MTTLLLIKDLLEAGVHFGHQTKRWNPKMRRFIFGERSGIYIIDLQQTERVLNDAVDFITSIAARGQQVLMVATKRQAKEAVRALGRQCEQPFVVNRWLGGTLTNFATVRSSVTRLRQLRMWRDEGRFERLSKKEASQLTKELQRLEYNLEGITDMERLPGALFVIDPHREAIAVREANRLGVPVVAICDTNCDPDVISFAVPGNDDAMRAIRLLTGKVADACLAGRQQYAAVQPMAPSSAQDPALAEALVAATEVPAKGPVTVEALEAEVVLPPIVETLEQSPAPVPPKAKRPVRPRTAKRTSPAGE